MARGEEDTAERQKRPETYGKDKKRSCICRVRGSEGAALGLTLVGLTGFDKIAQLGLQEWDARPLRGGLIYAGPRLRGSPKTNTSFQ